MSTENLRHLLKLSIDRIKEDVFRRFGEANSTQVEYEAAQPPLSVTVTLNAAEWQAVVLAIGGAAMIDERMKANLKEFFLQIKGPVGTYYKMPADDDDGE